MTEWTVADFNKLLTQLCDPRRYPHKVDHVDRVETHISVVLLAGEYAYKLKKPYNLGFLDFTTLEARKFYCQEELRLNRRLAPELYLEVIPITGSAGDPSWNKAGAPIEFAVKMRRFPQSALLTNVLAEHRLTHIQLDRLAVRIAQFHQALAPATAQQQYGSPETIHAAARQNFTQIAPLLVAAQDQDRLAEISNLTEDRFIRHQAEFHQRKRKGYIRECHGDLHLGNLVLLHEDVLPFDCIEFNPDFRWIDVMSEVAFIVMDLIQQGRSDLGFRFLNTYLEQTGDYAGLILLPYYLMFRAVVRAKIAAIRAREKETTTEEREAAWVSYRHHIESAIRFGRPKTGQFLLMHGLSGSGKSTVARELSMQLPAIHLRSDVERKRLHGLSTLERSNSSLNSGIYDAQATEKTYLRLLDLAKLVHNAGFNVIVDATFLKAVQRARFGSLHPAPLVISCESPMEVLRERVLSRFQAGQDAAEADVAVLEKQLLTVEPVKDQTHLIHLNTSAAVDYEALANAISRKNQLS